MIEIKCSECNALCGWSFEKQTSIMCFDCAESSLELLTAFKFPNAKEQLEQLRWSFNTKRYPIARTKGNELVRQFAREILALTKTKKET